MNTLAGLRDKLYWRRDASVKFHCFKKTSEPASPKRPGRWSSKKYDVFFESLCGRHRRSHAGGGSCARPPAFMRCGSCDVREIERRGKDESMPESPGWREYHGLG